MKLFKVPLAKGTNAKSENSIVVGMIDCSGSMSNVWKWVAEFWNEAIPKTPESITITFDTKAKRVEENILNHSINFHGGGGTLIPEAFVLMEKLLEPIPLTRQITVLFISDGQDNNINSLKQRLSTLKGNRGHHLNFICLGKYYILIK